MGTQVRGNLRREGYRTADPHKVNTMPSPRELEALHTTVRAGSMKMAAAIMGVSDQTIKAHLSLLYKKLDVGGFGECLYKLYLRELWNEGARWESPFIELWVNGVRYVPGNS